MKVLIVDDSPGNLKLLRAVLEAENFHVVEAADGVQALVTLEREPVDAIISDILMPGMDGYRLCYEVRKDKRLQALPFIFYTATYTSPTDEKLCYDLGGDKYLQKPAPAQTILAALSEAANMTRQPSSHRMASLSESDVMKEYSERLVSKLEAKNVELAQAKEHLEKTNCELTRRTKELERARTELQQINRELDDRVRQRTKELEASNLELEAFSYSVSHDLRAPLRHIDSYISLVLQNGANQLNGTNVQHLRRIHEAVQKMVNIIEALLELTRVTHAELHRFPVDLSALAREVFEELQESGSDRVVRMDIASGLTTNGDQRLLRVALINLLGNALKFTSKRAEARIQFGRIENNADPTYFVRDNGAGFDMAHADKLFGAFQRLHSRIDFEGTGIGLATVQRIIHRHNGKTWAEGIQDHGATFYFTLGENVTKSDEHHLQPKK
jgi:signal transduction histidine kinase